MYSLECALHTCGAKLAGELLLTSVLWELHT
jgi:hypothetical protein